MDKPVIKSLFEFEEYTARHLSYARIMRKLSRDDPHLVALDKLMAERWGSVVNCNSPTPEQRRAALDERENVANLLPRLQPAMRELLVRLHSLQAYTNALPAAGGGGGGWDLRADLLHPDNVIKMITAAMDDARCLAGLDPENALFKSVMEQLVEMARWTRTSLNPSAEDRARVRVGEVTAEMLDAGLRAAVAGVCRSMHDFCDLYANYPAQPPRVKMHLEPIVGPKPPEAR